MSPEKTINSLRWLERVMLVLFVGVTSGFVWLFYNVELSVREYYVGGGAVVLLLLVLLYTQRQLDKTVVLALVQTNFVQDDAFMALFDRSPVAYVTIDAHGAVVEANGAATKLLQAHDKASLVQVNFFSLLHDDEESEFDSSILIQKVASGLTVNDQEVMLQTFAGGEIWVLLSVITLRGDGLRLISLVDITEQKHIDIAKSEFVALATHQLRTPVAAIRWNNELLSKSLTGAATETQQRYLTKINRNVLRMVSLINDFLSVSKLEMGTYAANPGVVNVTDFFSAIIDEFSEKITQKNITLTRRDNPPQLQIKTDSNLLHIIVSNLVSNAVKYLKDGGVLNVSYDLSDGQLTIVIADNGIGIPAAEVPKLFTKFYRASNAQSHQTEGTGLGLYIVKQSAELLGGSISVVSDEEQGATFTVVLPAAVVSIPEIG